MMSAQKIPSVHLFINYVFSFFILLISCPAVSGLSLDMIPWDETLNIKSDQGEDIQLKFISKSQFADNDMLCIELYRHSGTGAQKKIDCKNLSFFFQGLPEIPEYSGCYSQEGEACGEFPPLMGIGFALLFFLDPQFTRDQAGSPTQTQYGSFVRECTAAPVLNPQDRGIDIIGARTNILNDDDMSPRIKIRLSHVAGDEEAGQESCYVSYQVNYYKDGKPQSATFTLTTAAGDKTPFLNSSFVLNLENYISAGVYDFIDYSHLTKVKEPAPLEAHDQENEKVTCSAGLKKFDPQEITVALEQQDKADEQTASSCNPFCCFKSGNR